MCGSIVVINVYHLVPLGTEVDISPGDFVFDGDPATRRKMGTLTPTQFLAHVYCGKTAGWMKTPLGTEVDLSPGHIVLDGVPAPAKVAQQPPSFRPMSIVATVAHFSYCWALVEVCERTDTQTDRHTNTLIAILHTPTGSEVNTDKGNWTI